MTGKKNSKFCHFVFIEDVKVAENTQPWWDIEIYASKIKVVSESKKELQAQKMLESTTKVTGERYEVGVMWNEPTEQINLGSALLTGAKIPKGLKFEEFVSRFFYKCKFPNSIETDCSDIRITAPCIWN